MGDDEAQLIFRTNRVQHKIIVVWCAVKCIWDNIEFDGIIGLETAISRHILSACIQVLLCLIEY